jgi:8-oxo-dGTP pyrophosphatase MutT (NUDIX family)
MIDKVRDKLKRRIPSEISSTSNIRASVVMPLYRAGDEEFLILMRRTRSVKAHPGEISFPGGMFESADENSQATALRECCEEIGVKEEDVEVIGRLDDERTLTGFVITPFVGIIPFPYQFSLSEREVSYLIHLPLKFLAGADPVMEQIEYKADVLEIQALYYKGERIWGATCRLLLKLKRMIEDVAI